MYLAAMYMYYVVCNETIHLMHTGKITAVFPAGLNQTRWCLYFRDNFSVDLQKTHHLGFHLKLSSMGDYMHVKCTHMKLIRFSVRTETV